MASLVCCEEQKVWNDSQIALLQFCSAWVTLRWYQFKLRAGWKKKRRCESNDWFGAEVKYTGCPHFPGETSGKSYTNIIVCYWGTKTEGSCIKDSFKDMVVNCLQTQHRLKLENVNEDFLHSLSGYFHFKERKCAFVPLFCIVLKSQHNWIVPADKCSSFCSSALILWQ